MTSTHDIGKLIDTLFTKLTLKITDTKSELLQSVNDNSTKLTDLKTAINNFFGDDFDIDTTSSDLNDIVQNLVDELNTAGISQIADWVNITLDVEGTGDLLSIKELIIGEDNSLDMKNLNDNYLTVKDTFNFMLKRLEAIEEAISLRYVDNDEKQPELNYLAETDGKTKSYTSILRLVELLSKTINNLNDELGLEIELLRKDVGCEPYAKKIAMGVTDVLNYLDSLDGVVESVRTELNSVKDDLCSTDEDSSIEAATKTVVEGLKDDEVISIENYLLELDNTMTRYYHTLFSEDNSFYTETEDLELCDGKIQTVFKTIYSNVNKLNHKDEINHLMSIYDGSLGNEKNQFFVYENANQNPTSKSAGTENFDYTRPRELFDLLTSAISDTNTDRLSTFSDITQMLSNFDNMSGLIKSKIKLVYKDALKRIVTLETGQRKIEESIGSEFRDKVWDKIYPLYNLITTPDTNYDIVMESSMLSQNTNIETILNNNYPKTSDIFTFSETDEIVTFSSDYKTSGLASAKSISVFEEGSPIQSINEKLKSLRSDFNEVIPDLLGDYGAIEIISIVDVITGKLDDIKQSLGSTSYAVDDTETGLLVDLKTLFSAINSFQIKVEMQLKIYSETVIGSKDINVQNIMMLRNLDNITEDDILFMDKYSFIYHVFEPQFRLHIKDLPMYNGVQLSLSDDTTLADIDGMEFKNLNVGADGENLITEVFRGYVDYILLRIEDVKYNDERGLLKLELNRIKKEVITGIDFLNVVHTIKKITRYDLIENSDPIVREVIINRIVNKEYINQKNKQFSLPIDNRYYFLYHMCFPELFPFDNVGEEKDLDKIETGLALLTSELSDSDTGVVGDNQDYDVIKKYFNELGNSLSFTVNNSPLTLSSLVENSVDVSTFKTKFKEVKRLIGITDFESNYPYYKHIVSVYSKTEHLLKLIGSKNSNIQFKGSSVLDNIEKLLRIMGKEDEFQSYTGETITTRLGNIEEEISDITSLLGKDSDENLTGTVVENVVGLNTKFENVGDFTELVSTDYSNIDNDNYKNSISKSLVVFGEKIDELISTVKELESFKVEINGKVSTLETVIGDGLLPNSGGSTIIEIINNLGDYTDFESAFGTFNSETGLFE
jgi:hypothetical protein